jgi:hypothetical protein
MLLVVTIVIGRKMSATEQIAGRFSLPNPERKQKAGGYTRAVA